MRQDEAQFQYARMNSKERYTFLESRSGEVLIWCSQTIIIIYTTSAINNCCCRQNKCAKFLFLCLQCSHCPLSEFSPIPPPPKLWTRRLEVGGGGGEQQLQQTPSHSPLCTMPPPPPPLPMKCPFCWFRLTVIINCGQTQASVGKSQVSVEQYPSYWMFL